MDSDTEARRQLVKVQWFAMGGFAILMTLVEVFLFTVMETSAMHCLIEWAVTVGFALGISYVIFKIIYRFQDRVGEQKAQIVAELSERKITEEALKKSEERYRSIFEGSRDAIFVTTPEGEYVQANQAALDLFGYTREEMLKMHARDRYADPADRERHTQELSQKGFVKDFAVKLLKKDGTEIDCLITAAVGRASDGSVLYRGIIRDITERKIAEEKDREQRKIAEAMAEVSRIVNSSLELDHVLNLILERTAELVPCDGSAISLMTETDVLFQATRGFAGHSEELKRVVLPISQEWRKKGDEFEVFMVPDVRDDPRWVAVPGTERTRSYLNAPLVARDQLIGSLQVYKWEVDAYSDAQVQILARLADQTAVAVENARLFEIAQQEITERKQTEEERERLYQSLAEKQRQLEHQIETAGDAIFNLDLEGLFTLFNREAQRLSGYRQEEILGKSYKELLCPEYFEQMEGLFSSDASSEALQRAIEVEFFNKRGEQVPVEMRFSRLELDERVVGFQAIGRDIRERKRLEEMKSQFIATISHDLRTPLASIMGFIEMVLEGTPGPLTEIQEEFMGIIYENSQRLLDLINHLLDVSKLETGRLHLEMETMKLDELITEVIKAIRPLVKEKGLELVVDIEEGLPETQGDPRRLEQVLNNLLSNAIKFTPEGGRVGVKAWQEDGQLKVSVADTGMGIPPGDLPHLFEPFHRATNATKKAIEGTGLGLHISKSLIEAHRGTIEAESELEKGTTFLLALPVRQPMLSGAGQAEST